MEFLRQLQSLKIAAYDVQEGKVRALVTVVAEVYQVTGARSSEHTAQMYAEQIELWHKMNWMLLRRNKTSVI